MDMKESGGQNTTVVRPSDSAGTGKMEWKAKEKKNCGVGVGLRPAGQLVGGDEGTMETVRNSRWQLHGCHRLQRWRSCIQHEKLRQARILVVHECKQKTVILGSARV